MQTVQTASPAGQIDKIHELQTFFSASNNVNAQDFCVLFCLVCGSAHIAEMSMDLDDAPVSFTQDQQPVAATYVTFFCPSFFALLFLP